MTPDERNLIQGLFDRMRSYGAVEKEHEAEALINTQVRQIPDSAYLLVQSVLVQDQALAVANTRVQQLEARVSQLEAGASKPASSGGSFLGGLFGETPLVLEPGFFGLLDQEADLHRVCSKADLSGQAKGQR